mmetsp:Transcript_4244/g.4849  ORF Transcript_4244/g.4849 Transcript_4244/m.4849 type:complete len:86 (-) Transcript_4244:622-879(-)
MRPRQRKLQRPGLPTVGGKEDRENWYKFFLDCFTASHHTTEKSAFSKSYHSHFREDREGSGGGSKGDNNSELHFLTRSLKLEGIY